MASEQRSSGPALNEMTPGIISSGLMPTTSPSTSYVPPSRNDWDSLFQPMFDELLNPPPSVVNQTPKAIAPIAEVILPGYVDSIDSPSSTTVDQDAPSTKDVATACFTQNRSIIRLRHGKTPSELLHSKLPDLSFFHVFGALCYPTNDSENLGKLQPKVDIGIFIGYAPSKKAF
nr:integrase, catalytic region, zinc finger, CCHC-type, peptidase aspartic, catalytic [Tanacetum cinerariifolium]